MARTATRGIGYGPLVADFFSDIKVIRLRNRYDPRFPYVYLTLVFGIIYREGYYIKWDDDLPIVLSSMTLFPEEDCKEAIDAMLYVGLLDKEMYDKHGILTSHGIQVQWETICRNCNKRARIEEFSLVDETEDKPAPSMQALFTQQQPQRPVQKVVQPEKVDKSENMGHPTGDMEVLHYLFFENITNPQRELNRLRDYNNVNGKEEWAKMTEGKKMSAARLWMNTYKGERGRFSTDFLEAWHKVYAQMLASQAPQEVLGSALSDSIQFLHCTDGDTLTCDNSVYEYIENNVSLFKPILGYMNLQYDVI